MKWERSDRSRHLSSHQNTNEREKRCEEISFQFRQWGLKKRDGAYYFAKTQFVGISGGLDSNIGIVWIQQELLKS